MRYKPLLGSLVMSVLILTFICSCSKTNENAEDLINKAKLLWDGKKYTNPKKAIEYLNNAIKLQPNNAETYFKRGAAHVNLGQYQQAFEDFNKAIGLKQDYAYAYNNRGIIYLMRGNKELGCRDAQKACELGICKALEKAKNGGYCR